MVGSPGVEIGPPLATSVAPAATPSSDAAKPSEAEVTVAPTSSPTPTSAPTPTASPSAAPTPTPFPAPASSQEYVVVAGDTLSRIARRSGLPLADLLGANPQVTDPDRLAIGDRLTVPVPCGAAGSGTPPRWTITDLGMPYGGQAYGIAVNDRGDVLIRAYDSAAMIERGFVWRDGTMTDIGTLGGPSTVPWAMNDRGQVVGTSLTSMMEGHPFLWQDGRLTDLGSPGPYGGDALDINDRGQVVGEYVTHSAHSGAFLWQDGQMTDLGTLGGDYARAERVNERGEVTGQSWTASGEMHAFRWHDGRMTDLGPIGAQGRMVAIARDGLALGNVSPTGMAQQATVWDGASPAALGTLGWDVTMGFALDDAGRAVGVSWLSTSLQHAFLWRAGTITDLGEIAGQGSSAAYDIDVRGMVVGQAEVGGRQQAVVWQGGVLTELPDLGGGSRAEHVSDTCMATGISTTASGETHAVLWTRS